MWENEIYLSFGSRCKSRVIVNHGLVVVGSSFSGVFDSFASFYADPEAYSLDTSLELGVC